MPDRTYTAAEMEHAIKQAHTLGATDYHEEAKRTGLHDRSPIFVDQRGENAVDHHELSAAYALSAETGRPVKVINPPGAVEVPADKAVRISTAEGHNFRLYELAWQRAAELEGAVVVDSDLTGEGYEQDDDEEKVTQVTAAFRQRIGLE